MRESMAKFHTFFIRPLVCLVGGLGLANLPDA